ncbi:unnamed protein product [Closterium sp. NIES-54]
MANLPCRPAVLLFPRSSPGSATLIMETSLRLNAEDRSLVMHAKENFVSDGNIALQVHAKLNTQTGKPSCLIQLKKKFFPEVLTSIDVGAKVDVESREVTYSIQGKKTWELTDNGLLCLDLKGAYNYQPHTQSGKPKASVELSQKVFNFTEDQDLKVKLGYNVVARKPYLQLRENNWTLNAELRETAGKRVHWSIAYDL